MKKILTSIIFLLISINAFATDWYVRTDGGTATQCDGHTNAQYPGSGTNQPCAMSHPNWVWKMRPGAGGAAAKWSNSDRMIFGTPGTFSIGLTAPNATSCSIGAPGDCYNDSVPAGTALAHTKILGYGWDTGCSSYQTVLTGEVDTWDIVNMNNTSYVDTVCVEMTQADNCTQAGINDNQCQISAGTHWGRHGIHADNSHHLSFDYVNIHGLAGEGFHAEHLGNGDATSYVNWTHSNINLNGYAGWNGGSGGIAYSGTFLIDYSTIDFNGCGENKASPGTPIYCSTQDQGGYGDAIGLADGEIGAWTISNSSISHNTSDGPDLLHGNGVGSVHIIRSVIEGNSGQQVKGTAQSFKIENSKILGNCDFMNDKSYKSTPLQNNANFGYLDSGSIIHPGAALFTGTGLNDMTPSGASTLNHTTGTVAQATFNIIIDGTGSPNTFKWQEGGGSFTTGVSITGSTQVITDGLSVRFNATTGHTLGDKWTTYPIGQNYNICRAAGTTIAAVLKASGGSLEIYNSTVYGIGIQLISLARTPNPSPCNSSLSVTNTNDIFLDGGQISNSELKLYFTTCDSGGSWTQTDNSNIFSAFRNPTCTGTNICANPNLLSYATIPQHVYDTSFDVRISATSPGIGLGDRSAPVADNLDYDGVDRGTVWDIGALQFGTVVPPQSTQDHLTGGGILRGGGVFK